MYKPIRLIAILMLLYVSVAQAQPYYFRHYQVENGLSNSTVFCSVQDKNGFLWFGTKDGLNRFDGYRFKIFNLQAENESTLSSDQISSLLTDDSGTLWVGAQKGLYQFDPLKEQLVPFIDSLKGINDLYIDRNKNELWFTSADNICLYDLSRKQLKIFSSAAYFPATSFCQTPDGTMWFSSTSGFIYRFDRNTGTFQGYDVFAHSPPARSHHIEKIHADRYGSVFIGTSSNGIKEFHPTTSSYTDVLTYNVNKTPIFVRDILQYSPNELWFATESGVFIFNQRTRRFNTLNKNQQDPYSISDNAVYCLYKDMEGGVWAGTYFGGINYIPKQYSFFEKYFPDPTKNSITGNVVRELVEDDFGNLWIGTEDGGLDKLELRTGDIHNYFPTGESSSIAYTNIHGLQPNGRELWIGTFENGLDVMDISTGKVIKHYVAGPDEYDLKSNFIVSMLKTRSGDLWVGSSTALYRFDPKKDGFVMPPSIPDRTFMSSLIEDHQGIIWIGTHNQGVYYLNPKTGVSGQFRNDPNDRNSLTTNTINALFEDSRHNLWIATEGGGLCVLDSQRKSFARYTTAQGLPSNFVFKVLEDDEHYLWASTSKGLVKLDPASKKTILYTKENGLLNDQFNYNSGYKDAEGRLYFGSVKGMIRFKPSDFSPNAFISPVYITGFQVHNKELAIDRDSSFLNRSIVYTDKIVLPHDKSSFSIDFAALGFTAPERTGYSYLMKGLDRDWTHLSSNRKVYFTNLSPGKYTFSVKASNNLSWGNKEKQLAIIILPPWWATASAYFIYIALAIGLLYYLVNSYHKLQEDKKEKAIYEAKIEFFTHVAHEIRTPLTLIRGPVENLSEFVDHLPEIKEDVMTMERNTNRLMRLVNQILDFRQTEKKGFALDFTRVNITDILKEAFITFAPIAKKRNLQYDMDLPQTDVYAAADEEALLKIFSNLFSNAVKYADKKVQIKLHTPNKDDFFLMMEIENDGFQIPFEFREKIFEPFFRMKQTIKEKGTGIGLALAHTLAELHNAKLFLKEPNNGMNTFVFLLPATGDNVHTEVIRKKNLPINT